MKRCLNVLFVLIAFYQTAKAQISIDNISKISITDQLNINYERVFTHTFEIRFTESIELWHTKQISRAEFQQGVFKHQTDSIYAKILSMRKKEDDMDSLKSLYTKRKDLLENAYLNYCDTVKAEFIKNIPENVILDLLNGLQDSTCNEDSFKAKVQLDKDASYGNSILMTSYYPLIGMTIYSSTGDTLVVYNNGQQDLMIPWKIENSDTDLYNPLINWSLDAILPEELNYNKKRLTKGMKK